jgi:polyhydroxyalkanoate synthase
MLALIDTLRQMQGDALEWLGLGPTECGYRIVAASTRWRLRAYAGATAGPPLLIVAAPIKRPYIWDLADPVSVVRHCLQSRLHVYLRMVAAFAWRQRRWPGGLCAAIDR